MFSKRNNQLYTAIILAISIFYSVITKAYNCNLTGKFDKKMLHVIQKANNIKLVDETMNKFTSQEYKIKVAFNSKTGKHLFMIGEAHQKTREASIMGKKLIRQFNHVMYELVPEGDKDTKKYTHEDRDEWLEIGVLPAFKRQLLKALSDRPYGSTVTSLRRKQLEVDCYLIDQIDFPQVDVLSSDIYPTIKQLFKRGIGNNLALPLEVGERLIRRDDDLSYAIDERNKRMHNSIGQYMDMVDDKKKMALLVGQFHLPGLMDLLKKDGYKECENFPTFDELGNQQIYERSRSDIALYKKELEDFEKDPNKLRIYKKQIDLLKTAYAKKQYELKKLRRSGICSSRRGSPPKEECTEKSDNIALDYLLKEAAIFKEYPLLGKGNVKSIWKDDYKDKDKDGKYIVNALSSDFNKLKEEIDNRKSAVHRQLIETFEIAAKIDLVRGRCMGSEKKLTMMRFKKQMSSKSIMTDPEIQDELERVQKEFDEKLKITKKEDWGEGKDFCSRDISHLGDQLLNNFTELKEQLPEAGQK